MDSTHNIKSPLTYTQQCEVLYKRNISKDIQDETLLAEVGYYNLINRYKKIFLQTNYKNQEELYYKGSKLTHFYALYQFDKILRTNYLIIILELESYIKATISYHFSHFLLNDCQKKFKDLSEKEQMIKAINHEWYLDPTLAFYQKNDSKIIHALKEPILSEQERIQKNKPPYYAEIHHYLTNENYGYVPIWILLNGISFGKINKFFAILPKDVQRKTVKTIYKNHPQTPKNQIKEIQKNLKLLVDMRNFCAHNHRIYDRRWNNKNFGELLYTFFTFTEKSSNLTETLHTLLHQHKEAQENLKQSLENEAWQSFKSSSAYIKKETLEDLFKKITKKTN